MKAINMKKMEIVTLFNSTLNDKDEYRLMNIGYADLKASKEVGGSEELKALIRERIEDLFNGDILDYFKDCRMEVTEGDIDYCIDELAKGHASNIAGEDFYWGDMEEVIHDIHKYAFVVRCKECGSIEIEEKWWVNPNTMEIGNDCEEDECWCNECQEHSRREVVRTEDYEREVADYENDIRQTLDRSETSAYAMRSDGDDDTEIWVTRNQNGARVMWMEGDKITDEQTCTFEVAALHVMRFQRLMNGKVKANCEMK